MSATSGRRTTELTTDPPSPATSAPASDAGTPQEPEIDYAARIRESVARSLMWKPRVNKTLDAALFQVASRAAENAMRRYDPDNKVHLSEMAKRIVNEEFENIQTELEVIEQRDNQVWRRMYRHARGCNLQPHHRWSLASFGNTGRNIYDAIFGQKVLDLSREGVNALRV